MVEDLRRGKKVYKQTKNKQKIPPEKKKSKGPDSSNLCRILYEYFVLKYCSNGNGKSSDSAPKNNSLEYNFV